MVKCKCGNEVAPNARACPKCGNRFTHPFVKFVAWCLGIMIVLAIIVSIGGGSSSSSPSSGTARAVAPPRAASSTTESINSKTVESSNWDYSERTDEMTGAVTKWACVESANTLDFDFPYNGGSTGELCLRKKGGQRDAYVRISKGQFMCGYDDCGVELKFDNGPVRHFGAAESDSGASDILFIHGYGTLVASTKKSKHIKLQAKFYQEGQRVLDFDVSGLKWE